MIWDIFACVLANKRIILARKGPLGQSIKIINIEDVKDISLGSSRIFDTFTGIFNMGVDDRNSPENL